MNVDLSKLEENLQRAKSEKTVPDDDLNPYLLNVLLRRLQAGEDLTYGEIDFSQFEADDLRVLAGYCESRNSVSQSLAYLVGCIGRAKAFCCTARSFC